MWLFFCHIWWFPFIFLTCDSSIVTLSSTNITYVYTFVTFSCTIFFFLTFGSFIITLCSTNINFDRTFVTFGGTLIFFPHIWQFHRHIGQYQYHIWPSFCHIQWFFFCLLTFDNSIATLNRTNITYGCSQPNPTQHHRII